MKSLSEFFMSENALSLGWTLIHSLWQAFILYGILMLLLRLLPRLSSSQRYTLSLSALLLTVVSSIITYTWLSVNTETVVTASPSPGMSFSLSHVVASNSHIPPSSITFLEQHMSWVLIGWMTGAFLFCLRVAGGGWFVSQLRMSSRPVPTAWQNTLHQLSKRLHLSRIVTLGESARIQAPVVLGYFKPVILLPVGMIAGLSTAQVEAILLHELAHIKRHDYLVNLIQLFVEAVFFFNPFVWIVSGIIRAEREHCCDDVVVTITDNAGTYAAALVQLEEVRLQQNGLALSLAENKHQLLTRIKRIMEKSVKTYSGREKMIPLLLVVIGLVCASWLTISRIPHENLEPVSFNQKTTPADTTRKKNKHPKPARKPVAVTEEVKSPIAIEEEVESDEFFMPPVPAMMFDFEPPVMIEMAAIPAIPPVPSFDYAFDYNFYADSIPPRFNEWEAFGAEFEEKFKERFADFYKDHQQDFDKMMADVQNQMDTRFDKAFEYSALAMAEQDKHHALAMKQHEKAMLKAQKEMEKNSERIEEIKAKHHATVMEQHEKAMLKAHKEMEKNSLQMEEMNKKMKDMEVNMKAFEEALKKELVKDGYLKPNEKISNIHWDGKGDIEVNGQKIKSEHVEHYQVLHDKFFPENKKLLKSTE